MARRSAFLDETWRLAQQRDLPSLRAAAHLLDGYDAHRARAFALAVEGDADAAVVELGEGRDDDWPFAAAYAADTARVLYLAGGYRDALDALGPAMRRVDRVDPAVVELVEALVRRAPALRRRALILVLGAGTTWQRARNAIAVATARG